MVTSVVSAAFMLLQNLTILRMEGRIEARSNRPCGTGCCGCRRSSSPSAPPANWPARPWASAPIRRVLSGIGPVAVQSGTVGAMNLGLLLWYSVPAGAGGDRACWSSSPAVFLGLGLWQLRWQRRLVELGNKLNNQAFQTLRGLPKLRVAAAESFAYAAWARGVRPQPRTAAAGRAGSRTSTTVLNAVYLPLCSLVDVHAAGRARRAGSHVGRPRSSPSTPSVTMLLTSVTQLTGALRLGGGRAADVRADQAGAGRGRPRCAAPAPSRARCPAAIEARKLSFRYADDGPLVLDDVSLAGPAGRVRGDRRPQRLRQVDAAAAAHRLRQAGLRAVCSTTARTWPPSTRRPCAASAGSCCRTRSRFTGSILDCICGAEPFTQEEAWEAAAMAGLAEDIKRMPMGLHTMISGGGADLRRPAPAADDRPGAGPPAAHPLLRRGHQRAGQRDPAHRHREHPRACSATRS